MSVYRTLIWFQDGSERVLDLSDKFFPYSVLLNRLLNKYYDGKKLKFLNIYFMTEVSFIMFPQRLRRYEYIMDHIRTYGAFDKQEFTGLSFEEQKKFVWINACKQLEYAGLSHKNEELANAAKLALEDGLRMDLSPDYKLLEQHGIIEGQDAVASIWAKFPEDAMVANFSLEKDGKVLMDQQIDKTVHGIEFFLEMFKKIEFKNNVIVIKGHRDVKYLPLKITVDPKVLNE
jgi:hypothetical protein